MSAVESPVESWFARAAATAEPLPAPRPRRSAAPAKPKPKPRAGQRRPERGFRVRASVLWMVVFAVMLVGVVTLNVAVMRAHVSVNDLDAKIAQIQQENAKLAQQYSSATAAPQIEAAARRAGLRPASSSETGYADMVGHK